MNMIMSLSQPWPWYVAGPIIGLTVPALLILGNKNFGISSSFRHVCASCFPNGIEFFKYEWQKERWVWIFIMGIIIGAWIASTFIQNPNEIVLNPTLKNELSQYGITDYSNAFLPIQIFTWHSVFSIKLLILTVIGGLLVGFGTRYADGCTSGHSIMGLSALNWPSLVATIFFMLGGLVAANFIIPYILSL